MTLIKDRRVVSEGDGITITAISVGDSTVQALSTGVAQLPPCDHDDGPTATAMELETMATAPVMSIDSDLGTAADEASGLRWLAEQDEPLDEGLWALATVVIEQRDKLSRDRAAEQAAPSDEPEKFYVVVRGDLETPGYKAAQALHAARQFANEHEDVERRWFQTSNTIAILEVDDVEGLMRLIEKASLRDIRISTFNEPDLQGALTAVAFEPGGRSGKLLKNVRSM